MKRLTGDEPVQATPHDDEGWGLLSASVSEAAAAPTAFGVAVRTATRGKDVDGVVTLGPEAARARRQATPERHPDANLTVMASGCLGLVYLTDEPGRCSLERMAARYPGLVEGLRLHPGIGFVLVHSERDGSLVLGASGVRYLASGVVEGDDPLADYGPNAVAHVTRTDGFAHVADIMVNARYDPVRGAVPAFEEFVGSHGGLGGSQSYPFALVPSEWHEPAAEVVGAEAMHRLMCSWLTDLGQREDLAASAAVTSFSSKSELAPEPVHRLATT